MATVIQVGTAAMGGAQSQAKLMASFVMANLGQFRFRQFAERVGGVTRGNGLVVSMPKWSDFASGGTVIAETATIALGTSTVSTATITVSEYGKAVDFSRLSREMLNVDPEVICREILARDARMALENDAEKGFDACNYRYVGTSTSGGAWTTNGTHTATNTSALNAYHLGAIRDYLVGTMKVPPFDAAGNYVGIVSVKAGRNIKDDASVESWRLYADPASLLSGEVGRFEGIRLVEATQAAGFSNAIGSGSPSGEAYFFGAEALYEVLRVPEQLLFDNSDYGRVQGIAWYAITGFGAWLNHIAKWGSA